LSLPDIPGLPRDDEGPVFREPWEAQVFALAVKLHEVGAFTWGEWAEMLGRELHALPERPYYECWLAAIEAIVAGKGLVSEEERRLRIAAWDRAARATPHGKPIVLTRS
jgi:nitrile hydratase accessory protein